MVLTKAERTVYLNGSYLPESKALISVHDKGVVYADAVFDTLRTFNGKPFRLREHVDRLFQSLRYARIAMPHSREELGAIVEKVITDNEAVRPEQEDWWVTVRVTSGLRPFDGEPSHQEGPTIIVECVPLPLRARARFFVDGIALAVSQRQRIQPQALSPNTKSTNYLNMMLAQREIDAKAPGHWVLMPDQNGNLAEGPGSNLFIVSAGRVITPSTEFILAGVSRGEVIEICADLNIPLIESDISLHQALNADEAFLTSTSLCVCPVNSIEGITLPADIPGPVTQRIMDAFAQRAGFDFVGQYRTFLGNQSTSTGL